VKSEDIDLARAVEQLKIEIGNHRTQIKNNENNIYRLRSDSKWRQLLVNTMESALAELQRSYEQRNGNL
jgi:hypothetical protein